MQEKKYIKKTKAPQYKDSRVQDNQDDTWNSEENRPFDWNLVQRLTVYLIPHRLNLICMYILALFKVGASITLPILLKIGLDNYIAKGDIPGLLLLAGFMAVILGILFGTTRGQGIILNRIGYRVLFDLRKDLFGHLQKLSFRFFDHHKTGQIITRLTSDVQVLQEIVGNGLDTLFVDILMLLSIIVTMFLLDARLSLIILITVPLFSVLVFYVRSKMIRIARGLQHRLSSLNAFINESISGIKVIRAFAREDANIDRFKTLNAEYYDQAKTFYPLVALFWQGVSLISVFGTVLVLLAGGLLLSHQMVSFGVIAAFLVYINWFFQPMQKLSNLLNQLSRAMASCERIFSTMDTSPEICDADDAQTDFVLHGDVSFKNVDFGYTPHEIVLRNVDFSIKAGTTVAIVGPTGAGKTTLINLLCRFYDPTGGQILIDGKPLSSLSQTAYRSAIALVIQDVTVFSGSVLDNILYGKPEASREEVIEITRQMGIHEILNRLPLGLDTEIGERGGSLSPGQKQLIALARALIRNPGILILDEASAYLDSSTEQLIQNAMAQLGKNRTNFIIAHRLSTIRNADIIFVMKDGRIIESGNHEELAARDGHYADLIKVTH